MELKLHNYACINSRNWYGMQIQCILSITCMMPSNELYHPYRYVAWIKILNFDWAKSIYAYSTTARLILSNRTDSNIICDYYIRECLNPNHPSGPVTCVTQRKTAYLTQIEHLWTRKWKLFYLLHKRICSFNVHKISPSLASSFFCTYWKFQSWYNMNRVLLEICKCKSLADNAYLHNICFKLASLFASSDNLQCKIRKFEQIISQKLHMWHVDLGDLEILP